MASTRVIFRVDNELLAKAKKKAKKMCCKSVQDYFTYLIQRDLFSKHGTTGRPLTGIARDVAFLEDNTPIFKEQKTWFKKKKK